MATIFEKQDEFRAKQAEEERLKRLAREKSLREAKERQAKKEAEKKRAKEEADRRAKAEADARRAASEKANSQPGGPSGFTWLKNRPQPPAPVQSAASVQDTAHEYSRSVEEEPTPSQIAGEMMADSLYGKGGYPGYQFYETLNGYQPMAAIHPGSGPNAVYDLLKRGIPSATVNNPVTMKHLLDTIMSNIAKAQNGNQFVNASNTTEQGLKKPEHISQDFWDKMTPVQRREAVMNPEPPFVTKEDAGNPVHTLIPAWQNKPPTDTTIPPTVEEPAPPLLSTFPFSFPDPNSPMGQSLTFAQMHDSLKQLQTEPLPWRMKKQEFGWQQGVADPTPTDTKESIPEDDEAPIVPPEDAEASVEADGEKPLLSSEDIRAEMEAETKKFEEDAEKLRGYPETLSLLYSIHNGNQDRLTKRLDEALNAEEIALANGWPIPTTPEERAKQKEDDAELKQLNPENWPDEWKNGTLEELQGYLDLKTYERGDHLLYGDVPEALSELRRIDTDIDILQGLINKAQSDMLAGMRYNTGGQRASDNPPTPPGPEYRTGGQRTNAENPEHRVAVPQMTVAEIDQAMKDALYTRNSIVHSEKYTPTEKRAAQTKYIQTIRALNYQRENRIAYDEDAAWMTDALALETPVVTSDTHWQEREQRYNSQNYTNNPLGKYAYDAFMAICGIASSKSPMELVLAVLPDTEIAAWARRYDAKDVLYAEGDEIEGLYRSCIANERALDDTVRIVMDPWWAEDDDAYKEAYDKLMSMGINPYELDDLTIQTQIDNAKEALWKPFREKVDAAHAEYLAADEDYFNAQKKDEATYLQTFDMIEFNALVAKYFEAMQTNTEVPKEIVAMIEERINEELKRTTELYTTYDELIKYYDAAGGPRTKKDIGIYEWLKKMRTETWEQKAYYKAHTLLLRPEGMPVTVRKANAKNYDDFDWYAAVMNQDSLDDFGKNLLEHLPPDGSTLEGSFRPINPELFKYLTSAQRELLNHLDVFGEPGEARAFFNETVKGINLLNTLYTISNATEDTQNADGWGRAGITVKNFIAPTTLAISSFFDSLMQEHVFKKHRSNYFNESDARLRATDAETGVITGDMTPREGEVYNFILGLVQTAVTMAVPGTTIINAAASAGRTGVKMRYEDTVPLDRINRNMLTEFAIGAGTEMIPNDLVKKIFGGALGTKGVKGIKRLVRNLLSAGAIGMFSEMGEDGVGSFLRKLGDYVNNKYDSEWVKGYRKNTASGMSEGDALTAVIGGTVMDMLIDSAHSAPGGLIIGIGSHAIGSAFGGVINWNDKRKHDALMKSIDSLKPMPLSDESIERGKAELSKYDIDNATELPPELLKLAQWVSAGERYKAGEQGKDSETDSITPEDITKTFEHWAGHETEVLDDIDHNEASLDAEEREEGMPVPPGGDGALPPLEYEAFSDDSNSDNAFDREFAEGTSLPAEMQTSADLLVEKMNPTQRNGNEPSGGSENIEDSQSQEPLQNGNQPVPPDKPGTHKNSPKDYLTKKRSELNLPFSEAPALVMTGTSQGNGNLPVTVTGFASIEKGQVMVSLSDGQTLPLSSVVFKDPAMQYLYTAAKQFGSLEAAEQFLAGAKNTNLSLPQFYKEYANFYRAGRYGASFKAASLEEGEGHRVWTAMRAAYTLGAAERSALNARLSETDMPNIQISNIIRSLSAEVAPNAAGVVLQTTESLTRTQAETVAMMNQIAKQGWAQYRIVDTLNGESASYDAKTGVTTLALDAMDQWILKAASNNTYFNALMEAPVKMKEFLNIMNEEYFDAGGFNLDAAIKQKQLAYELANDGAQLDENDAKHAIAADYMAELLANPDIMARLVTEQPQLAKNLTFRLRDYTTKAQKGLWQMGYRGVRRKNALMADPSCILLAETLPEIYRVASNIEIDPKNPLHYLDMAGTIMEPGSAASMVESQLLAEYEAHLQTRLANGFVDPFEQLEFNNTFGKRYEAFKFSQIQEIFANAETQVRIKVVGDKGKPFYIIVDAIGYTMQADGTMKLEIIEFKSNPTGKAEGQQARGHEIMETKGGVVATSGSMFFPNKTTIAPTEVKVVNLDGKWPW